MATWQGMAIQPRIDSKSFWQFFSILLIFSGSSLHAQFEPSVVNNVTIELQIDGLSKEGCIVEIAPGHPACKFKKVRYKVEEAPVLLQPIKVTSLSLDRDCSFAITIKEPGMPEYTVRRGLRLAKSDSSKPETPETRITCHLATPSQIQQARIESEQTKVQSR